MSILSISAYILLTAFTAVFSYLHGRDHVSKGYLVAGLTLASAGAGLFLTDWNLWGLVAAILSPLYWFLFRTSRQARAELDYMAQHAHSSMKQVLMQYILPVGVCVVLIIGGTIYAKAWLYMALILPCIASVSLVYVTAKHFRNDDGEQAGDNRWPVETFGNGICGGINISCVLAVLVKVLT